MKNDVLIRVYLEKKFLLAFRLLMFSIVVFCLWPIYSAYNDGYVIVKGSKRMAGEVTFYSYQIKELIFASLFIWLGTGGAKEKKPDDKSE